MSSLVTALVKGVAVDNHTPQCHTHLSMVTRVCRSILLELKKSSPRTQVVIYTYQNGYISTYFPSMQVIYNNEPWIYIKDAIRNSEQSSHTMADLQNYLHYLTGSRRHVVCVKLGSPEKNDTLNLRG